MQLALKINVETYRGTLQGVPRLVDILRRHQAQATFCFALGPDRIGTSRANKPPAAQAGEAKPVSRIERYGLKTLLYGTLLPGPNIGKQCVDILQSTASAGFETAIHGWDIARWQNRIHKADATWTEIAMRRAHECYARIFGTTSPGHAAAGWQMNPHALRLTQRLGYHWASDTRGTHPFLPVWNGEIVRCPQLPTTLPTIDELIGCGGVTADNVHEAILQRTAQTRTDGHVFTLSAELEGIRFPATFELLLTGLREQGYALGSLGQLRSTIDIAGLPRCDVSPGQTAGGTYSPLLQGEEFLASWKDAA